MLIREREERDGSGIIGQIVQNRSLPGVARVVGGELHKHKRGPCIEITRGRDQRPRHLYRLYGLSWDSRPKYDFGTATAKNTHAHTHTHTPAHTHTHTHTHTRPTFHCIGSVALRKIFLGILLCLYIIKIYDYPFVFTCFLYERSLKSFQNGNLRDNPQDTQNLARGKPGASQRSFLNIYTCMYVCMYACIHACVYVHMFVYVCV